MNETKSQGWNAGLLAVILVLALTLLAAQLPWAEGAVSLLGLIALGVCLIALILVVAALWPAFSLQAMDNLERVPGKTLVIGLVNYVFLGAIALVSMNLGPIAVIGLALAGVLLLGTFLGLPAVAALVGARLHNLRERETNRWGEIVTGSAALYLAVWVPAVGWFLLLPALCLCSFGTAALTLVNRYKAEPAA